MEVFGSSLASEKLDQKSIDTIADYAKDWAQVNGICVRHDKADRSDYARIQAFSLAPSYVPVKLYDQAYDLQKDFGRLYHNISFDAHFLETTLKKVCETDHFTLRLMELYRESLSSMHRIQPTVLTIQRADYMFDEKPEYHGVAKLKQVEVNTMASGAAAVACKVREMHKNLMLRFPDHLSPPNEVKGRLAPNEAVQLVAEGIIAAWRHYGKEDAIIVIVIEGLDLNAMDQRMTEFQIGLCTNHKAKVVRYTLKECDENLRLDEQRGLKLVDKFSEKEVAVVYFRSGYSPHQYVGESEWNARRKIERSMAIKCPWVGAQLAGSKKIQQALCDEDVLRCFEPDPSVRNRLVATFAQIHGLDSDSRMTELYVARALKNPEKFVLKPQREGGGNNLFDDDIVKFVASASPGQLEAHILMERFCTAKHLNVLVRAGEERCRVDEMDTELGTFGFVLGGAQFIVDQDQRGHLMRTKPARDREGGTIKGTAGHDAPFLVFNDLAPRQIYQNGNN